MTRTIDAIREDMHLRKLAFDAVYRNSPLAESYSRKSIQRQWFMFQEDLQPLMTELARAEAIATAAEREAARQLADDYSVSVRKGYAA